MTDCNPAYTLRNRRPHTFRRGDWVEVRSPEEIQATLDAEGKLGGLPFMPEMLKYCGRKFRVSRRADRIFLDRYCYVAGLKDAVFLENIRCDGQAHDGCQMRCELFWKEAWLKPADPPNQSEAIPPGKELVSLNLPTRKGDRFTCQATELVHAASKLPWWDPRQYVREVMLGETTVGGLFEDLLRRARHKILRIFKRPNWTCRKFYYPTYSHRNSQPSSGRVGGSEKPARNPSHARCQRKKSGAGFRPGSRRILR